MENSCSSLGLGARSRRSSQGLAWVTALVLFNTHFMCQAAGNNDGGRGTEARPAEGQGLCAQLPPTRHACMEGKGRWLETALAKVKDKRLFLRAVQISDKAKGYDPRLTDSPSQAQSSPSLTPFSLKLSNEVRPFGSRCWGSPPKLSASSGSTVPGRGWHF